MRTLSRREALYLLIAERAFHDDLRGAFEDVLREGELLRRLRPSHAPTFWNSAVWEAIAGRATRNLAKTDPEFSRLADESFARARRFAQRAIELGVIKPDNNGAYVKREETIRLARRRGEAVPLPPPDQWDAAEEIERVIRAPAESEFDSVTAFRKPGSRVPSGPDLDAAIDATLAHRREIDEIDRMVAEQRTYNAREQARLEAFDDAIQRLGHPRSQDEMLRALDDMKRAAQPTPQVFPERPQSSTMKTPPLGTRRSS